MKKEKTKKNLFKFIKNCIINPIENMDNNTKDLDTPKKAIIFASILSIVMMILNLLTTILTSIFVRSCDFWTGKCKTRVIFENIGNLDYFNLIVKYLFMYAIFAFGVALVYYIIALIYKKNSNYFKVLSITLVAFIPNIVLDMILGPILGIVYGPLSTFASVAGNVYTIFILLFSLKNELKLNDTDKLIAYSLVCVVLLYMLKFYIFTEQIFVK